MGKNYSQRLFRGHADPNWKLSSAWERLIDSHRHEQRERGCISSGLDLNPRILYRLNVSEKDEDDYWLSRFKQLAVAIPAMPDHTHWKKEDWWSFGRHFGLNTPLLDWSKSPFIAAFWAFVTRVFPENKHRVEPPNDCYRMSSSEPVVVWELSLIDHILEPERFRLVDNISYDRHRQKSQSGIFTILDHDKHTDLEVYLSSRGLAMCLDRYEIPCSSIRDASVALSDLNRMNINFGTVFPDPEGAAIQANLSEWWTYMESQASDEDPFAFTE